MGQARRGGQARPETTPALRCRRIALGRIGPPRAPCAGAISAQTLPLILVRSPHAPGTPPHLPPSSPAPRSDHEAADRCGGHPGEAAQILRARELEEVRRDLDAPAQGRAGTGRGKSAALQEDRAALAEAADSEEPRAFADNEYALGITHRATRITDRFGRPRSGASLEARRDVDHRRFLPNSSGWDRRPRLRRLLVRPEDILAAVRTPRCFSGAVVPGICGQRRAPSPPTCRNWSICGR